MVAQPQIIAGVFDHGTSKTFTLRDTLVGVGGHNNAGMYVVNHEGRTLLMKTTENFPNRDQDSAKSTTREAYMHAMAAESLHDSSAGVVPRVHFAGLEDAWNPTSFLVMDWIDPPRQLPKNQNPISKNYTMTDHEFLKVADSTKEVVSHMLGAGISHNDIGSHNVILLRDHHVALIDFGESCLLYFGGTDGPVVPDDFRTRFSCHLFGGRTEAAKHWVGHSLGSAGYSDVRATFGFLYDLLLNTDGVAHAKQFSDILLGNRYRPDDPDIYSHIPTALAEGGGWCPQLVTPNPDELHRLHVQARDVTDAAISLLERVVRMLHTAAASPPTTPTSTSALAAGFAGLLHAQPARSPGALTPTSPDLMWV